MSTGSPTAFLLWAILSCIFIAFLLLHLWAYDRFNCLKWDSGRQPGAFKRVMTYSYLATLPLLIVFSVAMTALKFKAGFIVTPAGEIIPRPLEFWTTRDKHWLLPLYFVLSAGWSLELVTHLEELSFWLFLLHQGPAKREWFHSWEYRTWYLGSMVAVVGMPLITLVTRRDIVRVQAWIFLAGASAGTSTTVSFLYVLARFPGFIQYVKDGGAEPDVVVRLATFYSLNRIRVVFRFLFTVPLLMIGIDALKGPYPIVSNAFAVDFLLMMGGIGCFVSSAITLLIFFPRSITRESGYKAKIIPPPHSINNPTHSKVGPGAIASPPLPNYYTPNRQPFDERHDMGPPHKLSMGRSGGDGMPPPASPAAASYSGMRLNAFRYPTDASATADGVYPTDSMPPLPRRRSTESEMSPGYETDAESIALGSPVAPFNMPPPSPTPPSPSSPHHESSQTAVSRPSVTSGGRSDDTVWERHDDYFVPPANGDTALYRHHQLQALQQQQRNGGGGGMGPGSTTNYTSGLSTSSAAAQKRRRPHSDGPFVYNRHGIIVAAIPGNAGDGPGSASVPASSDGGHASSSGIGMRLGMRSSDHTHEAQRDSAAPALLHPYLMNFTSPIDLYDDSLEYLRPPHVA